MAGRKVAKEIPVSSITLRKYEKPRVLSRRELIKKICLSLGLLQPGDSRDVIVDILDIMLKHPKGLHIKKIEDLVIKSRKKAKLEILGVAQSNITRQLRRLKELYIVEHYLDTYRLSENLTLKEIFEERIVKYHVQSTVDRINEYLVLLK
jgi:DNA-binding transcriptional ArsR family regulator